jgi:hypothetical protein
MLRIIYHMHYFCAPCTSLKKCFFYYEENINMLIGTGSVADPGCLSRIRIFSHPGSQKTWGGKKIFYICFLTFL